MHDAHDTTPYLWSRAMFEMWQKGWWYPQWLPQVWFSFGAPIFHYYAPLYYWLTCLAQGLGLDPIIATKMILGVSLISGGLGMFYLARQWLPVSAAVATSGLYLWAPYYLSLLYRRAAFPEFFALNLVPWVLLAVVLLYRRPSSKHWWGLTISLGLVMISHILTAATTIGLVLLIMGFWWWQDRAKAKPGLRQVGSALLISLLLSAWYWWPTIADKHLVNYLHLITAKFSYTRYYADLIRLINLYRDRDWAWFSLGVTQIIIWVAAVMVAWARRKRIDRWWWLSLGIAAGLTFLSVPLSEPIWKAVPMLAYFQFPSRFLGPAGIFIALAGGWLIAEATEHEKTRRLIAGLVMTVAVLATMPISYTKTSEFENGIVARYLNLDQYVGRKLLTAIAKAYENADSSGQTDLVVDTGSIPFEYLPYRKYTDTDKFEIIRSGALALRPRIVSDTEISPLATVTNLDYNLDGLQLVTKFDRPWHQTYEVTLAKPTELRINMVRFPFWNISLDGKKTATHSQTNELGQLIEVGAGTHQIDIAWQDTPATKLSRIASGLTLVAVLLWFWRRRPQPTSGRRRVGSKTRSA